MSVLPERAQVVVDTLRFLSGGWLADDDDSHWSSETADVIEKYDFIEDGWCCPCCQEVICDGDCPLAPLRQSEGL